MKSHEFLRLHFDDADVFSCIDQDEVTGFEDVVRISALNLAGLQENILAYISRHERDKTFLVCLHGNYLLREMLPFYQRLRGFDVGISLHFAELSLCADIMIAHRIEFLRS